MKGLGSLQVSACINASHYHAWWIYSDCIGALFMCSSFFLVFSPAVPSGEHLIKIKQVIKFPLPPHRMMIRIPIVVDAFVGNLQATIF